MCMRTFRSSLTPGIIRGLGLPAPIGKNSKKGNNMAELKMIKKDKCKFENGFVCKGSKIIGLPADVALQIQKLELMIQQYEYLASQPAPRPMPSLDGFKFNDGLPKPMHFDRPDTPTMDARVAEAMAFCEEVEEVDNAIEVNKMIDRFTALINWCNADKFVAGDYVSPLRCPRIGDPLKLTEDQIVGTLLDMVIHPVTINMNDLAEADPAWINELTNLKFKKVGKGYHEHCCCEGGAR